MGIRTKAGVIRKAPEESINAQMPASIILTHPPGMVMMDEAGSLVEHKTLACISI